MELSDIQGLLAQFQPSQADQDAARKQAIMAAGLGLLGARKGFEFDAIGRGGLLGMQNYQQQLMAAPKMRMENLQAAATLRKTLQDMQFGDMGMKLLGGGAQQQPDAQQPPAMGDAQQMPPGAQQPPQQQAPQATGGQPSWANPTAELAFSMMGKKDIADVIHRQYQITQGPSGTLMRNGQIVGQVLPNVGMVVDGKLQPLPKEATDALVNYEGAKAAAVKAAENPYQITEGVDSQGRPVKGYAPQLFGQPPVQRAPVAPQGQGGVQLNLDQQGMTPQNLQAIAQNIAQSRGISPQQAMTMVGQAPNGPAQGPMVGADPLQMEAAKGAIATQTSQNTKIADAFAGDYADAVKAEKMAPATIQKYQYLKNMWGQVETGKLAPTVQSLKAIAAYAAPDLAKTWTKDVPYYQAASALSNAMALELRNPAGGAGMPGSLSDADRQYLQSMISSAANDPRAIPMVLDAKIALEKRNQDLGKIARDYRAQTGRIDEGLYEKFQQYADAHPLFPKQPAMQAPAGGSAPNPQAIVDELRRRGVKIQ